MLWVSAACTTGEMWDAPLLFIQKTLLHNDCRVISAVALIPLLLFKPLPLNPRFDLRSACASD